MSLLFNMLSRLVRTFLPRSKHLLISWLQSISAVILEPPKIKSLTVSTISPSVWHEVMGPDAVILVFWMLSFKPTFSLSSFTFIKRLFSSFLLSAIRVVSSEYLRLLIFLPAILKSQARDRQLPGSHQKLEEILPQSFQREVWPCQHLDLRLLASRTVLCLGNHRKLLNEMWMMGVIAMDSVLYSLSPLLGLKDLFTQPLRFCCIPVFSCQLFIVIASVEERTLSKVKPPSWGQLASSD